MSQSTDLTQSDGLLKKLLLFTLPLIAIGIINYLMSLIDLFWLSRLIGQQSEVISSFRTSLATITLLEGIIIGVSTGFNIVLTQFYGAKQYHQAQKAFDSGWVLSGTVGLLTSIVGLLLLPLILLMFGVSSTAQEFAKAYLLIYFSGFVFVIIKSFLYSSIRNMGDSKSIMYVLALMLAFNMIATPLSIKGFMASGASGMMGAAAATIAANLLGALCFIFILNKLKKSQFEIRFRIKSLQFWDKALVKKVVPIASAQIFNGLSFNLSMFLVILIVSYYSDMILSSLTIGMYILQVFALIGVQFATAIFPFAGQNIGAQKWDNVNKILRYIVTCIFVFCSSAAVLVFFFKNYMLAVFSQDPQINQAASQFLNVYLVPWILNSVTMPFIFTIGASGDSKGMSRLIIWNMYLSTILPLAILPHFFTDTAMGVWVAYSLSAILAFSGTVGYFMTGKWKKARVVEDDVKDVSDTADDGSDVQGEVEAATSSG